MLLAVVKWKKIRGFTATSSASILHHHRGNMLINGDLA